MKTKFYFLFFCALAALASACGNSASVESIQSNTVQSSQIYQIYEVEGTSTETTVYATFRVGGATGTTVELTAPGKITYNGAPLPYSPPGGLFDVRTKGSNYFEHLKGFPSSNTFDLTDADGKTYSNSITLEPVRISTQTPVLRKNQPTIISFSRPLATNEKLLVTIDQPTFDEVPDERNSVYLNPSRTALIVTPQYRANKSLKNSVYLAVKIIKTTALAQATRTGGTISAKYTSDSIALKIDKTGKIAANSNSNINAANVSVVSADNNADSVANQSKRIVKHRRAKINPANKANVNFAANK